jgi:hypothetical protein
MDRWLHAEDGAFGGRPSLPPSISGIEIDADALWGDLSDEEQWAPLREAVRNLIVRLRGPRSFRYPDLDVGQWNMAHAAVVFEVERLHYLLLARQLNERIQEVVWEEPLASLVHGLDVAVSSAMETGRQLAVELNEEMDVLIEGETYEDPYASVYQPDDEVELEVDEMPAWGRGYAYVLYRRYVADLQTILDLHAAVCAEAYEAEGPEMTY